MTTTQIIDANGAIHAGENGRFTGRVQQEGDAEQLLGATGHKTVLPTGHTIIEFADGDEREDANGITSTLHVDEDGTRRWKAFRMDSDPDDPDGSVLHADGGPALIGPLGRREWRCWGELHNYDGPAVTLPDGTAEYWLFGKRYDDFDEWQGTADALREQLTERAQKGRRVFEALDAIHREGGAGTEPGVVIEDLVTDLQHYFHTQGLDLWDVLTRGQERAKQERIDPML